MVQYLNNNYSGFNQWRAAASSQRAPRRSWFSSFLWWTAIFMACWWLMGVFMRPAPKNDVANETPAPALDLSAVPTWNVSGTDIDFSVQGLRISNIALNKFSENAANPDDTEHVTLVPADTGAFIEVGLISQNTVAPTAETVWTGDSATDMKWHNSTGVNIVRSVNVDDYVITVTDSITNQGGAPVTFAPYARIMRDTQNTVSSGVYTGLVAYANNDIEREDWSHLNKKSYAYTTTNGFVGFADQYWETVVSIDSPDQTMRAKKANDMYAADAAAGPVTVASGDTANIITHIYAGPRDQATLNAASSVIAGINKTVDYGWFWFLARPMLWVLNGIHAIVMNYGVAIIIMTILLRLLMWPLTRKSYTSMITMQKMQPEMARIQKLYANDKARLQMEMMRLYQTHRTSPMSGCLPMLLQIPIFFALYKALLISVPMRGASFLWIHDLAAMDPYFILPILMGGTMWLQSYLQNQSTKQTTANANDVAAQTQKFMKWMPVLFTVLFAWMPAGLVLYWTVSNLFGIAQMYIIKHQTAK